MKNRIISIILVMIMMAGTFNVAMAADTRGKATRDSLKSYGSIEYHKGNDKVVFNAEDLYMLADQIDQVKMDVTDQLEAMNTYFTAGDGISLNTNKYISVTHARPSKTDIVDPVDVNFDTLLEGIAASQSVSQDVMSYGYAAGTKLYIDENGSLTTDGSAGAKQISISAATADNLSAGTVAWVNGRLILGTGGDNKAFYESGYQEGAGSSGGSDDPSGDVNKARFIQISGNGKTYVVSEAMSDVFLFFTRGMPNIPSPTLSSGEAITLVQKDVQSYSSDVGCGTCIYYCPSLAKGTVISNISGSAYLITISGCSKNGQVNPHYVSSGSEYIATQDMTDVLLVTRSNESNKPFFAPMDGQPYTAYRLLKSINVGSGGTSFPRSVYYIPKITSGTKITNIGHGYFVY